MSKSAIEKMKIKAGMRTVLINVPPEIKKEIEASGVELKSRLIGEFDYIHFFAANQKEFLQKFPKLKEYLKPNGKLWVSWQKNKPNETDLTLTLIIKLGYDFGLVESKTISINSVWSAIKFTRPVEGKIYQNSYGKLKN